MMARMPVHEVAQAGFGSEADTYERWRPGYPPEAVAWLVDHLRIGPGATVLDLAAGTGKLTRLLAPSGAALVAVEPVEGMRTILRASLPEVPTAAAAAEALPFAAGTLDAITVAQAFHWFDAEPALADLRRVLRPGGRLGLIWNARDRSVDWVDALWSVMDRVEKLAPWRDHDHWHDHWHDQWHEAAFGSRAFGELREATFRHAHRLPLEGVVERFRSVSHVAALPPDARAAVLSEVRDVLHTHPATRDRTEVDVPYRVDTFWCERT
jgi:SAM-dependent methyltransferase